MIAGEEHMSLHLYDDIERRFWHTNAETEAGLAIALMHLQVRPANLFVSA